MTKRIEAVSDAPQAGQPAPIPTLVDAALALAASGWPVFPCKADKSPVVAHGFLSASADPAIIRGMFSNPAAKLIGIPTGQASGVDALDFDYRHGAGAFETDNKHRLPETRTHQTQSAGRHLLFVSDPRVRNSASRVGPGVDVRGQGGYICVPPSPGYSVISGAPPAPWPEWLLQPGLVLPAAPKERQIRSSGPYAPAGGKRFEALRLKLIENVRQAPDGAKHERLRDNALSLGGIAAEAGFSDNDAVGWLMDALAGKAVANWKLAEDTARWALIVGREKPLTLEDRPHPQGNHKLNGAAPPYDHQTGEEPPPQGADDGDAQAGDPEEDAEAGWQKYLQKDDRGQVIPNVANVALALRQAPELVGIITFDEMLQHTLVNRSLPGSRMAAVREPRPARDTDITAIQEWLQRHGLRRIGKDITQQACDLVAREHSFHPVKEYLTGLTWDRKGRLNTWLSYYLGAEASPYVAKIGRWFLIAMVARIMQPGCKCDYMLVLEGEQGSRKSAACAILAGLWFSDNLPDLHQGDAVRLSMHLRGKWLIEVAEMSSISKADTNALKEFLTQREERYTPKFARNEVIEPRQCSFVGTTNARTYLRDETGGRRFWPVQCGTIDTIALAEDRDQLFAEAMAALVAGEAWWPDAEFEAEHIKPEQDTRFISDEWENIIRQWLGPWIDAHGVHQQARTRCTVAEVATEAVKLENTGRLGTADQRRITTALHRIGWIAKRDNQGRWWEAPVTA